ncbi:MAG: 4-(cytidine 5'-diphospho)-2-C-methyl-D-erythritol kinase [Ruminococcaceae bacterium]|nr:4-(cytidine 5'-diphospho)-2-C-methyl-D-erythritol kinase [Oscillospiraceae bacterium]
MSGVTLPALNQKTLTLPAFAKLNLTLDILRKRPDGYHDLQMVMQSIELHDDVTVTLTDGDGIVCRCGDIPGDESNLAVRAARAFFDGAGVAPCGLDIDIVKRIPAQAGMAGGSSDAAATLRALRKLLRPELLGEDLERIGTRVGSDVPYCLRGGTALAEGRGERLTTLRAAPKFHVVLCKPEFSISTPELFSRVRVAELWSRPDTGGMLDALHRGDAEGVLRRVKNVFETVLPQEYAEVFTIKGRLHELGARATAMTGSGPTVFGLFEDEAAAEDAYDELSEDYEDTFLTRFV